jgi:hypothetical protein
MVELPKNELERVIFCFAYGDKFSGDNHEEALRMARFAVLYCIGMKSASSMGLSFPPEAWRAE